MKRNSQLGRVEEGKHKVHHLNKSHRRTLNQRKLMDAVEVKRNLLKDKYKKKLKNLNLSNHKSKREKVDQVEDIRKLRSL